MDLKKERERTELLLAEVERLQLALDKVTGSARREIDSRLQAEEALNETEERLKFAVEATGLALWDYRYPFTDVYLTARWGELIGDVALEGTWPADALVARLHPEDAPRVASELRLLLKGEVKRATGEYRFMAQDQWVWLETHAMVAERDKQGRVTRVLGTHANVTQRKQLEERAQQALDLAEKASRAKSEFLANMSHEVRTPLNAIMGLNHLLLETQITDEQRQWLKLMEDSSRSLLNLLNDVLDLSRIEAGKLRLEQVYFPVRPLIESAFAMYTHQARQKSVDLTMALSDALPEKMSGDPFRLRQVLTNLMSNALKFTPSGGKIALTVEMKLNNQVVSDLVIRLADTGIGIAPEQQKSMFDAFTQADASTARQHGGSGLGLAICSRLVKMMGGQIEMKSVLGQGSTFQVDLPVTEIGAAPGVGQSLEKLPLESNETVLRRFQKLRVIVAEDNSVNELLMRKILEGLGCEVRVAHDGDGAVRLWESWPADIVLMDVQMPGVNGLMATARIREAERSTNRAPTPILAVTANAMPGDREAYMASGMSGYVSKPIEFNALLQSIIKALPKNSETEQPVSPVATSGANATTLAGHSESSAKKSEQQEPSRSSKAKLSKQLSEGVQTLRRALTDQNSALAQEELDRLRKALAHLEADRALRICRGLDMARHAGEWGLFSRALPLFESEVGTLMTRLDPNTVNWPTN